MKIQTIGRKAQNLTKHVFNTESTITIKKGAPVALYTGTSHQDKLGMAVKSIESLAAAEQGLFFGIAMQDIPPGSEGETVYGFYQFVRTIVRTRAASTDVWASTAAIAVGDFYSPNTAASNQAVIFAGAGSALTLDQHKIKAADTLASATTLASSITTGNSTCGLIGLTMSWAYRKTFIAIF